VCSGAVVAADARSVRRTTDLPPTDLPEIVFIAPGEVHLAFPFAAQFCQQNGFMHAGAMASVADSANGYAAYTLAPPDTDVLARYVQFNLLAPAQGAGFLACGRVLRPGRSLKVCQADVFPTGAAERALIATMLSTIIVRPRSPFEAVAFSPASH
jgi:uncharacterized protein (TIGR00369 family)